MFSITQFSVLHNNKRQHIYLIYSTIINIITKDDITYSLIITQYEVGKFFCGGWGGGVCERDAMWGDAL